jgi:nicotinamidase/pyrazinamidase
MRSAPSADSALLLVDVQNDFCPGGALAVPDGDSIVPVLNDAIAAFRAAGRPIIASRDWHPARTTHFKAGGGLWPPHCVAGTPGAEFHARLALPIDATVISKGTGPDEDAYSAFAARDASAASLDEILRARRCTHLVVGGLATDYCVLATTLEAIELGFSVTVLVDGIRGVEVTPGDSDRALARMRAAGARMAPD